MNWIDIISLTLALLFGIVGLWRGLLVSVFRLCAWIAAIFGAIFAQDIIGSFIATNMALGSFAVKLVCMSVGFLVPFLTVTFIGHIVNRFVTSTILSKANRLLGGLFGFMKGVIICGVLLAIIHIIPASGDFKTLRNSAVAYAGFKYCLESMGYSSNEIDLRNVAEKKASQLTNAITGKAVEKAKETAIQVADSAKKAVQEATLETIKSATENDSAKTTVASTSASTNNTNNLKSSAVQEGQASKVKAQSKSPSSKESKTTK